MADSKVDVKTLGRSGVIIDRHPLDPSIPDDALLRGENVTHDPSLGYGGAVRKRPGLAKFNQAPAGGAILGGIPMAVAGTGGAPVPSPSADGPTGDSTGSGDGTGAPGSTLDGASAPTYNVGVAQYTGSQLFAGARLIAVGFGDTTAGAGPNGHGWWLTSKKFADAASRILAPGPPEMSAQVLPTIMLSHASVLNPNDGYLYYVKSQVQSNDGSPVAGSIRKTNGGQDVFVATIPLNLLTTATHRTLSVQNMTLGADGNIYLAIVDNVTDAQNGRLMKLALPGNALTELNLGVPAAAAGLYADFPQCLAYHEGRLFWGTAKRTNDTGGSINALTVSNGISYGGVDLNPGADQRYVNITHMIELSGVLYALTGQKTAGTAQRALVLIRQPFAAIGAASAWSSLDINPGDTIGNLNFYCSIALFKGLIYVSYYNPSDKARIYQCTPGLSGATTTLLNSTSVFNSSGTTGLVPFELFVDDGVLYAYGSTGSGGRNYFQWTVDGVNWTNATSNFSQSVNGEFPIQVAFGMSQ